MGGKNSKPSKAHDPHIKRIKKEIKNSEGGDTESKDVMYRGPYLEEAWPSSLKRLPKELEQLIDGYHANDFDVRRYSLDHCKNFTLFGNNAVGTLLAFYILHGRRTAALDLAQQHPEIMTCIISGRDPYEREAIGTPLQLAGAAGNPLLVSDLRLLLSEEEAAKQLNRQFPSDWKEKTKIRMEKEYLTPLRRFIEEVVEIKLSPKGLQNFEQAKVECKTIINKYRDALRPKPADPVKTGLIFDPQVYPDAYEIILSKENNLGRWNSCKTKIIITIGFQSLLGIGSAFTAQILIGGMNNYFDNQKNPPENLIFIDGRPFFSDYQNGLGGTLNVGFFGDTYDLRSGSAARHWWGIDGIAHRRMESYAEQVYQDCMSYAGVRHNIVDFRL